jgi:hypothetical protein
MISVIARPTLAAGVRAQAKDGVMLEVEGIVQRETGAVKLQYVTLQRCIEVRGLRYVTSSSR